ncbi:MAG: energy transducer TonB [Gammaproteobacteria bacterium]|nr:energy transducer TonB [Gammaproteobacteria bacterium]
MGRLAISALIACGIVVGLYLLMISLIGTGDSNTQRGDTSIDIGQIVEEKEVQRKERRVPKKPPPPKEPPPPQQQVQEQNKVITNIVNVQIDNLDATFEGEGLYAGSLGQQGTGFAGFGDGDAIPLSTVPAQYPQDAQLKGITGHVKFVFDIEPDGSPSNIQITESKPRRVFDKEARRAIRRWKFKPKQYNGQPVKQTNMRYTMEFQLDN